MALAARSALDLAAFADLPDLTAAHMVPTGGGSVSTCPALSKSLQVDALLYCSFVNRSRFRVPFVSEARVVADHSPKDVEAALLAWVGTEDTRMEELYAEGAVDAVG